MLRVLDDRIALTQIKEPSKTEGGIYIPQIAQRKTQEGIVKALGDKVKLPLKVEDHVVYDRFAGVVVKQGDEEFLILKEEDLLAKLEG